MAVACWKPAMKAFMLFGLIFAVSRTACLGGPPIKITFMPRPDVFEISAGRDDGLQKGQKLAVIRDDDNTVTFLGQIEVLSAESRNFAVCRPVTLVPGVVLKEGDQVVPPEILPWLVGRVTKVTSNDAVEVLFHAAGREDRLRVYRETPRGIVECGQLKVTAADKDRCLCKALPKTLKTVIQPGDRVTQIWRWRVQNVDKDVVTLSVGSEDGLSAGNRFLVYRDSPCVVGTRAGRIEVLKAEPESSVCKVLALEHGFVFEKGDVVVPGNRFPRPVEGNVVAMPQPETVEVDVGTDQKLVAGDVLKVLRTTNGSSSYIGRVTIVKADAKKSLCRVDRIQQLLPIETGDRMESYREIP